MTLKQFIETLGTIGITKNLNQQQAKEKVRRLKKMNEQKGKKSGWQKLGEWLAQPVTIGVNMSPEEAHAANILQQGYWEGINNGDKVNQPEIHKHLHLHGVDEKKILKRKIP